MWRVTETQSPTTAKIRAKYLMSGMRSVREKRPIKIGSRKSLSSKIKSPNKLVVLGLVRDNLETANEKLGFQAKQCKKICFNLMSDILVRCNDIQGSAHSFHLASRS
jgi:hypothetical protein